MLKDELQQHLCKKLLPWWNSMADMDYGGWYGYMDADLNLSSDADKGCILNSRILWSYATAYRVLGRAEDLQMARRALDFMAHFEDPVHGGVYWSVTADGLPADTAKHTYCQAFAVYGMAAWVRATGDKVVMKKALDLFHVIEDKCRDAQGYNEAGSRDFTPSSNEKLSDDNGNVASRTMNTLLHVVQAWAQLYRACGDEEVRESGARCLQLLLKRVYAPEKHKLEVFFDHEYQPVVDIQSYGHDIEASWLLWDAAVTLLPADHLQPYKAMCLDLAETVFQRAMSAEAGLMNERISGVDDPTRIWWVQCEAMLGFANAWRITGSNVYRQAVHDLWRVILDVIVDDREGGEWYWGAHADGSPMREKPVLSEWKCPYHNSRMLLRIIEEFSDI